MNGAVTKVIIGEAQDLPRELLKSYLIQHGFEVPADVSDGLNVIVSTFKYQPDIVVLDLDLPVVDGIKAAKSIKDVMPEVKVLAVTALGDSCFFHNLKHCIDGYIKKPMPIEIMPNAVKKVIKGEEFFYYAQPVETGKIAVVEKKINNSGEDMQLHLTKQEKEILKFLLSGMDNRAIAREFSIAVSTVKFHVRNLLRKYKTENRVELLKVFELGR